MKSIIISNRFQKNELTNTGENILCFYDIWSALSDAQSFYIVKYGKIYCMNNNHKSNYHNYYIYFDNSKIQMKVDEKISKGYIQNSSSDAEFTDYHIDKGTINNKINIVMKLLMDIIQDEKREIVDGEIIKNLNSVSVIKFVTFDQHKALTVSQMKFLNEIYQKMKVI